MLHTEGCWFNSSHAYDRESEKGKMKDDSPLKPLMDRVTTAIKASNDDVRLSKADARQLVLVLCDYDSLCRCPHHAVRAQIDFDDPDMRLTCPTCGMFVRCFRAGMLP